MPGLSDNWLGSKRPLAKWDKQERQYDFARLIDANEYTITLIRGGAAILPQVVRIEAQAYSHPHIKLATNMEISVSAVVIIGYRDHPTIPDTDIKRGDRFLLHGQTYAILNFVPAMPGHLFAIADVSQTGSG